MVRKNELNFAREVVKRGEIPGEKVLECIELLRLDQYKNTVTLMDLLVEKGYISRKKAKSLEKELNEKDSKQLTKEILKKVGHYNILEKLGEGAMGVVYKAQNAKNGRIVALKLLDHNLAKDSEFIARFLREARNAAKLKNHKHIVEVYDFGENKGSFYMVMELVEGHSLAEILYSKGKLDEKNALNITKQVARALKHAHKFSIIHRDIKPENIMISKDGIVKLCDYGLAKDLSLSQERSSGGITLGTAYYVSPEQAMGSKTLDIRSDIYSLGISLYHMLSGELPFNDSDTLKVARQHVKEELPPIEKKNPELSQESLTILKKMTEKDIRKRYKLPQDILEDINNILEGKTIKIVIDTTKQKPKKKNLLLKKKKLSPIIPIKTYILIISIFIFLLGIFFLKSLL